MTHKTWYQVPTTTLQIILIYKGSKIITIA